MTICDGTLPEAQYDNGTLSSHAALLRTRINPAPRLLLVQAPQFLFESVNVAAIRNRAYYAFPPTGLQWLATALDGSGIEVEIFDMNRLLLQKIVAEPDYDYRRWLELLDSELERFRPSLVGVTCLTVYSDLFNGSHPLTEILRHVKELGDRVVIAGGPLATNEVEGYLQRGLCDYLVTGEGEEKLRYLMEMLLKGSSQRTPRSGIHFFHEGAVRESAGSAERVNVAGNLTESYRKLPVESYHEVGCLNPYSRMVGQDTRYGVFQLNRGCRCNCAFCGVPIFMGRGIRTYQAESALEEVRYLVRERGVRHFEALDDDLLADVPVLTSFLQGLAPLRREYGITWSANNGMITNALTEPLLELMRDSGCVGFKVGIESGDSRMLRRMKKPGTPESFKKIAARLQGYPELFVGGNYIIGLFGSETFGQMLETYRLSVTLNLDWSSFTLFQVTSKETPCRDGKGKEGGGGAIDFIPTKSIANRSLREDLLLPLGPEIFRLPADLVPSRELMNNVWLTFNLAGNYIGNKNLKAGGDAGKFVAWVEAVQLAYPDNPYMRLFAALGQTILGNRRQALDYLALCKSLVQGNRSWEHRFAAFGLDAIVADFPETAEEVFRVLDKVASEYPGAGRSL